MKTGAMDLLNKPIQFTLLRTFFARRRLASSNTHVNPVIDGAYLSDEADLKTIREGLKLSRKLGESKQWGEYLGNEVLPGKDLVSDAELDQYIKNTVHTANALVGTCKIGAVVDGDLSVKGVKGVRVVDSSVMPNIPGGQTGTPTVMIAEKAADIILGH
tara:strand:- start:42 stop:518 length:477 start_codon:yes stop_codon:yes gene_type:complete